MCQKYDHLEDALICMSDILKKYYVYFQATFLIKNLLNKEKKVENGTTRQKTS